MYFYISKHLTDIAEVKAGIQMQKSSSATGSTPNQGYKAPKQGFNRQHFVKPYHRDHGQFDTPKTTQQNFFSSQPGTKKCQTQTTKPKPEGLVTAKVRPQPIPTVNADL